MIKNLDGEKLARATAFAAKGDVRYYLNGVYIEKREKGGVNIVATNGHIMCIYRDKTARPGEDFDKIILDIYEYNCPVAKTGRRINPIFADLKKSEKEKVVLDKVDDEYRIGRYIDDLESYDYTTIKEIDGRFPNYKAVIPSKVEHSHAALDVKYINLLKGFVMNDAENGAVTIATGTENGPTVFQTDEGIVLIMAMVAKDKFKPNELIKEAA